MYSQPSNLVDNVNGTIWFIFVISAFFLVGITVTMIYFVKRYNRKRNPVAEQIEGNMTLEIVWTVIPVCIVLIMFYTGWGNWKMMKSPPKDAFTVKSTARMWSWSFTYPNGKVTDTLYVPVNKAIKVNVTSEDVIHSMYIPAFRVKQDMNPGNDKNFLWFIARQEGKYLIYCAEYCGLRHSYMNTRVVAMPQNDFNKWYNDTSSALVLNSRSKAVIPGMNIIKTKGCLACHSLDGSRIVGPSFKGIYGNKTTVVVGGKDMEVTVDDKYIFESIYTPDAKVVKGFQPGIMQPYKDISREDAQQIIDYIKTLK